jgi:HEAT repeat protein
VPSEGKLSGITLATIDREPNVRPIQGALACDVGDPAFTSVLLGDLANFPDDEVRSMAANALAQYIDDPAVRAALERAESDASFEVRYAARRALEVVPD